MRVGTIVDDFTCVKHFIPRTLKKLSRGLRDRYEAVNLSGARARNEIPRSHRANMKGPPIQ